MSIFSRFRDIVSSNINAMLDKAEDPEKLIRLMIQEMEDTLVELKANCASAMADSTRALRNKEAAEQKAEEWGARAELALSKNREDLAREALLEKRSLQQEAEARASETASLQEVVSQYQSDIRQLEEKLEGARQKHRVLVQRHTQARTRYQAQTRIRKADTSDVLLRFDSFEQRIDRMEAEAGLVNYGRQRSLDDEFSKLHNDDALEQELSDLKAKLANEKPQP